MANRVFQNVVYQMKDAVDRVVGVIDETGTVISCSELTSSFISTFCTSAVSLIVNFTLSAVT